MNDAAGNLPDNPYQSPATATREAMPRLEFEAVYSSARTLAHVVVLLFVVLMVASCAAIGVESMLLEVCSTVLAGEEASQEWADELDGYLQLIGVAEIVVSLSIVVMFLMWFYKSHKNLRALGASSLDYTPAWAIGGWFVPILWFFRPYQVAREIWLNSNPATLHLDRVRRLSRDSTAVIVWWLLFVGLRIIERVLMPNEAAHARLEGTALVQLLERELRGLMIVEVFRLAASIAAVYMVIRIASWQEQRYEKLNSPLDDGAPEALPGFSM